MNKLAARNEVRRALTKEAPCLTYLGMASYWPTPMAMENDAVVAGTMNRMPKIVFSTTLDKAEWNNTTLIQGDIAAAIQQLKQQPGRDLIIFGSANLAASLTKLGLIDEYGTIVNPVVLGRGTPLFQGGDQPLKLRLLQSRTFKSGNVLLYYAPARAG